MQYRAIKCTLSFMLVLLVLIPASGSAQQAGDVTNLEMLQVVNTPTAGVLKRGQYQLQLRSFAEGGMQAGISMGLFDRFMFGVSFGGMRLLGFEEPIGYKLPGAIIKYRLIEETQTLPAIALGFDMQGYGDYYEHDDFKRYWQKAPGFFASFSRNLAMGSRTMGLHGGVNFNTIENIDDDGVDFFGGIDFSLNEQISLIGEYDAALDDNIEEDIQDRFGTGKGYLNAGVRFSFAQSLVIEAFATDLLQNSAETKGFGREIRITYIETFTF